MITITKNQVSPIKVRLNQSNLIGDTITITLDSPSRSQLVFSSVITTISDGYYSFDLDVADTSQLIDDTYFYSISQEDVDLKKGVVRFLKDTDLNNAFDYTLDFTLA